MIKNDLQKYLVVKKDKNTHFCLIISKKNISIITTGTSEQTVTFEIKKYEDSETLQKEVNSLIHIKLEQGYKEEIQPEELSVFSIAIERLKTEDIVQFENNLLTLKNLVDIYDNRNDHPFVKFLEIEMKDEELVTTPILDEFLQKHMSALSSSSLVHVFKMTLQNIYFNFEATSLVVEEIIKRKDLEAQIAIIDQFFEACEYYDAGHRFWSSTNQDELIDTFFPKFESEALLKLLKNISRDMLHSDEMDGLFIHALHNTDDKDIQQKILDILEAYKKEYEEEEYVDEEYFDTLLKGILEVDSTNDTIVEGIERIKENKQKKEVLLDAIEEFNLLKIEELLDQEILFDEQLIEKVLEKTLEKNDLSFVKLFKNKGIQFNIEELFKNPEEHIGLLIEGIETDIIAIDYIAKESNKNLLFFVDENKDLLEVLLKKGVNVNHRDSKGDTILRSVCSYAKGENQKYIDVVKLLLEHMANPNISLNEEGWEKGMMPLHYAVKNEAVEITKLLINAAADVNAMPSNGKNPLMLAHQGANAMLIDILTQAGATAPERELLKIKFIRCASKQEWDQLVEMEEEIIAEYPEEFIIILNLAQAHYFSEANYRKALEYAKRALSLESNNKSLNILFMSLIRLGQAQESIDLFLIHKKNFQPERALASNIIANLIVAYCASNQIKEGIEVLSPFFSICTESKHEKGVMNFNIACMYALANDIHEMLPYVINALERKYTKEDFINESDFTAYHANELFLFVLNQDHKNTIELEEYAEDSESKTFKKINVKAFYNTGTFSFENEEHEVSYTTGTIGEEGKVIERLYTSKAQALVMYFKKLKEQSPYGKNNYFILKEDTSSDSKIRIKAPEEVLGKIDFLSGNKVELPMDTPIVFVTNAKAGDTIRDFNSGKIPVISKKFLDLLLEAGVDTIQTFPVSIKSKKDGTVWEDYFAINLLDVIACGAFPKSIFKENKPKDWIRCELVIDAEKANGALFFRLKEHLPTILFHRSVGRYIIDNDPDEMINWEFEGIVQ
ncbi:ankyrin repeat domain-containing protein [Aquimarina aquimarini]|uniref:ankyrin repeat domain-containing protein n=1 Tax=Aquimarina aquimarini TaxID=1191734 RepID=UPI000D560CBB|nr:ankyrin repeat domain-containing protein [Aquimarina aquimarini]